MFTMNLRHTLNRAAAYAGDSEVTSEHLLAALTDDPDAMGALEACGVIVDEVRTRFSGFFKTLADPAENSAPKWQWQAGAAVEDARITGTFAGSISGVTLLMSLFSYPTAAASFLRGLALAPEDIANYKACRAQGPAAPLAPL